MKLDDVLSALKVNGGFREAVAPGWEKSMEEFPVGIPSFLCADEYKPIREYCGMKPEADDVLDKLSARIAEKKELLLLAWHCYYQMLKDDKIANFRDWPLFEDELGDLGGAFYLIVALAMVPFIRTKFQELGVPDDVCRDTCGNMRCLSSNYENGYGGMPGVIPQQLYWIRHYIKGEIFRLGRMEYWSRELKLMGKVFRDEKTGRKILFAMDGQKFDKDGFAANPEGPDAPGIWKAEYMEDAKSVTGNPLSAFGHALRDKITLPLNEWKDVLREGSLVLDMHIPAGGNMSPEVCLDSLKRAFDFFGRYLPERKSDVISCRSWIFSPQYEKKLPDSNIAKFMRELYLYPFYAGDRCGFFFAFLREYKNLAEAPRDTSLRRAMLELIDAGEPLRGGGMFIFREDLKHFGTQCYRGTECLL
ncbi:MAG: hypothetical protein A2017_03700 [Lentisphaerae bacterium GWF2_44_16]|nr:MAG: hypothetical protein A2017_03700 [Lentisphaerae bacterium GWF2_44_16]